MKKLLLVMAVFMLVGSVLADSQFYDTTGDHLWTTEDNWDNGIPVGATGNWAKIRGGDPGAFIYSGTDAACQKIAIGYADGSVLTVDGGTLTVLEDIIPGRNGTGTFNVISGTVDIGRDLDIPYSSGDLGVVNMIGGTINIFRDIELPDATGQTGQLNMTGGTINIGDDLDMNSSGTGLLNLDGGTIILNDTYDGNSQIQMAASGGRIDFKFGTLILPGDEVSRVQGYIDNEWITGFGIIGNMAAIYDGSQTTVTAANDPLERTPGFGEYVPVGNVDLGWINLEPVDPATEVWVDVYFGTDVSSWTKVVDMGPGTTTTGHTVSAPVIGEYVWRVDTYRLGQPDTIGGTVVYGDDANSIDEGMTMYFVAYSDEPPTVVIDTPPTATWIGEPISLQATVTDDGSSDVSVVWTSDADPNAVFSNETYNQETKIATADVTTDSLVWGFTVTVTVSDVSNPDADSDTVVHYGASDACAAARNPLELDDTNPADIDGDCDHDLSDFATIASDWIREDYKPLDAPLPFTGE